ncbi:MAG: hypothetical protein INH41_09845 [Myxococcaceae bacterium]|jgi:hypothetical protein|nr:hypothetical protein [Myxococcaceae bacterium]MCA3012687.1 hypothetical protein [Myxococcaceae bacterium]
MRWVPVVLAVMGGTALAQERAPPGAKPGPGAKPASAEVPRPKLKGRVTQGAPKIDLGLPAFDALPRGEGLERAVEAPAQGAPTATSGKVAYTVVSMQHGKAFIRSPTGARPSTPFPAVTATGSPLVTEAFTTVVRVRAPERKSASIEVQVTDARGDTVMEASGALAFKADESDWTVEWEPTPVRSGGEYQVSVRIGGAAVATGPLTIEAKKP